MYFKTYYKGIEIKMMLCSCKARQIANRTEERTQKQILSGIVELRE